MHHWHSLPLGDALTAQDAFPDPEHSRCSFPPSVGHERHFHGRHFGYAMPAAGYESPMPAAHAKSDLATGSSFTSPGVAWHEVVNIGDTTVVYLIIEPK